MFEGQPKGLFALALANTGERFGYYTMLAVFTYFLLDNFGLSEGTAGLIYSGFLAFVYLLPLPGGIIADRVGYGKCVKLGILIMFLGYLLLAMPLGGDTVGMVSMFAALALVCIGTGLFKGNLQVMVGNLYEDPQYAAKRDTGFSVFYMFINLGAMAAATAAVWVMNWLQQEYGVSKNDAYHGAFAVACFSLIVSIVIYYCTLSWFAHTDYKNKPAAGGKTDSVEKISPAETKERLVALALVFAVCTFFWMAFHQNGLTLSLFAREYTEQSASGFHAALFYTEGFANLLLLISGVIGVFAFFSTVQSKTLVGRIISAFVLCGAGYAVYYLVSNAPEGCIIDPALFQQFNAFFVVSLTPFVMVLWTWLASKGKEPKAPLKIALGMIVAAASYAIMMLFSVGLPCPDVQKATADAVRVTPNVLITIYFTLTVAELLLSPVGISFVSKVAPPQYKGAMMGCWFVSTFAGNFLVAIPGFLWGSLPINVVWGTLMVICLLSAGFIFSVIKKLNKVA